MELAKNERLRDMIRKYKTERNEERSVKREEAKKKAMVHLSEMYLHIPPPVPNNYVRTNTSGEEDVDHQGNIIPINKTLIIKSGRYGTMEILPR